MLRGREDQASRIVSDVEKRVARAKGELSPPKSKLKIAVRDHTPWSDVFGNMLGPNRRRFFLGLALMVAQSFFFNAVFFTYGLVVKRFFGATDRELPMQLFPFAVSSFLGPLLLGRLFDRIGRKPMITASYGLAGVLLAAVCYAFWRGLLSVAVLGIAFSFAIAIFYAIGTLIGGVGAPCLQADTERRVRAALRDDSGARAPGITSCRWPRSGSPPCGRACRGTRSTVRR